jgi:hypothetical protein
VFGTLARQLLAGIELIPEPLAIEIEKADHDGERIADYKQSFGIFRSALGLMSGPVRVIFDGLDEASERSQDLISAGFKELVESPNFLVKLIVTGREELGSSLRIHSRVPFYKVPVSADAIAFDIGSYVQASTRRRIADGSLVLRDCNLERVIVEALVKGAKGM